MHTINENTEEKFSNKFKNSCLSNDPLHNSSHENDVANLNEISNVKNILVNNKERRFLLTNIPNKHNTKDVKDRPTGNGTTEFSKEQCLQIQVKYPHVSEVISSMPTNNLFKLKTTIEAPPKPPLSRTRSAEGATLASNKIVSSNNMSESIETTNLNTSTNKQSVTSPERPSSFNSAMNNKSESSVVSSKYISSNHYERLIEELKCPGCASAMKAPILLCHRGHSVCEQCTRILLICPLCKEPFTNIRSRSIEALCSKAHFRCSNASGGCLVRLQIDLLAWHERQCIYKPMKCFMGRVWGDCQWNGREAFWKEHLESAHANKVFKSAYTDLVWNMSKRDKPLSGYYVFEVYDEMFNFYVIYDNIRLLFTMTCTSPKKEQKHYFAYEVAVMHDNNEALAITQKFPVHSEYDNDILMDGTCVSISIGDLAKFIGEDKVLHYSVRIIQIKPHKKAHVKLDTIIPSSMHAINFQQTQIEGVNLKNVPSKVIVTRNKDIKSHRNNIDRSISLNTTSENGVPCIEKQYSNQPNTGQSDSESDPEFSAYINQTWGTPQMNFNRKFLITTSRENSAKNEDPCKMTDDNISVASTSYKKRVTSTLRKSFRSLKSIEIKPLLKRSSEKKFSH